MFKYEFGDRVVVNGDTYHGGLEKATSNAEALDRPGLVEEWHAFAGASGTVVKQGVFLGVLPVYGVLLDEVKTLSTGKEVGGIECPLSVSEEEILDGDQ